eukprot:8849646-Alexandrium_andersonii.AAC.1
MKHQVTDIPASPARLCPRPDGLGGPRHRSAGLPQASNCAQDFRARRRGRPILRHDPKLCRRRRAYKAGQEGLLR